MAELVVRGTRTDVPLRLKLLTIGGVSKTPLDAASVRCLSMVVSRICRCVSIVVGVATLCISLAWSAEQVQQPQSTILKPADFEHYVAEFNADDAETTQTLIPNRRA